MNSERILRKKEADARRKRLRRIKFDKEDRDALRELASSRDDGPRLDLPPTPEGLRETAVDGTPRSAKSAGTELRQLTQTFYERLAYIGLTGEALCEVEVKTEFWSNSWRCGNDSWETGVRRLKNCGGDMSEQNTLRADEDGYTYGFCLSDLPRGV